MHTQEEWSQRNWGILYLEMLQNTPKIMSASWIQGNIASAKENDKRISLDKQEYAFGPNYHVSI